MINKNEVIIQAKKHNLEPNIVEKDYVLNWLLAGIAASKELSDKWIFKGGTCLKKCYFEEYRFSEDLDFTISETEHIDATFLTNEFCYISEWVYENSGLKIPVGSLKFEEYENPRGKKSVRGKVAYEGPLQRRGANPTIKLDLSCDEILVEDSVRRRVYHPYSDLNEGNFTIRTYCIEEIFAEKLRALTERMRPRDLYDVVHLHKDKRWQPDGSRVLTILRKKCEFKNVLVPSMESIDLMPNKQDLIADWDDMLAHQIAELEPVEHYWGQLPGVFEWLYGRQIA